MQAADNARLLDGLMTREEAAHELGVGTRTLDRALSAGCIAQTGGGAGTKRPPRTRPLISRRSAPGALIPCARERRHVAEHTLPASDRIVGAEDHPSDVVQQDGARAHQARLQRGVDSHLSGPRPRFGRHGSQGFDFGVSVPTKSWMPDRILALCYHLTVQRDDGADGEIAFLLCLNGEVDGTAEVPLFNF